MGKMIVSGLRSMESNHRPITLLRCKLVVVGDACVGKSALTQVFHSGGATYPKNYLMTVGAEFCVKQVPITGTDTVVEIFIYDCAGQSIFNQLDLNAKYYENTAAVMLVYSISSRESLQSCNKWLTAVKANRPNVISVLVGNKCEFRSSIPGTFEATRAEVAEEDALGVAATLDAKYFETSAANNIGVEEPFQYIAQQFYKRYEESIQRADGLARNFG